MFKRIAILSVVATIGLWAGCGGSGGGSSATQESSPDTIDATVATVTLRPDDETAVALVTRGAEATIDVAAYNEAGAIVDTVSFLGGEFTLDLPVDHDYLLVFTDSKGVIGALTHGTASGEKGSWFHIQEGLSHVDLGSVSVKPELRIAHAGHNGGFSAPHYAEGKGNDTDGDFIPNWLDTDDDNDGIVDSDDMNHGDRDRSRDHDNDGINDTDDSDSDNDGIDDVDDDFMHDFDNDGEDDDRDMDDDETHPDHPGNTEQPLGDAVVGSDVYYSEGCDSCHNDDGVGVDGYTESIRNASVREVATVLREGAGYPVPTMPAYMGLVYYAADIAAFLFDDVVVPVPVDTDGDGITDDLDACPTQGASQWGLSADGCPLPQPAPVDTDSDGIIDDLDACPTQGASQWGLSSDGCPLPQPVPVDTDGDGIIDDLDACPTQGASQWGLSADGCPLPQPAPVDTDSDGITDDLDACPTQGASQWGLSADGCPLPQPVPVDTDGDGIIDDLDACPTQGASQWGLSADGCPLPQPAPVDTDSDGIIDDLDACPTQGASQWGLSADGCPLPMPVPVADGQAVYDNNCSACHALGSYDPAGFAPDLSGEGSNAESKLNGGHKGTGGTMAEGQALSDFVNAN